MSRASLLATVASVVPAAVGEDCVRVGVDSFDHGRLWRDVLHPLGPGGTRRYRTASHDLVTDERIEPPTAAAPPGSVVIVDGLFLHPPHLVRPCPGQAQPIAMR